MFTLIYMFYVFIYVHVIYSRNTIVSPRLAVDVDRDSLISFCGLIRKLLFNWIDSNSSPPAPLCNWGCGGGLCLVK